MAYVEYKARGGGADGFDEYLSPEGDWHGEFTRLISSRHGTARVAIQLADMPGRVCPTCGWLCKTDGQYILGCPACGWTNLDENNG